MRIALCQINPIVGDIDGNVDLIVDAANEAQRRGCELAVFPELAVSGYLAGDLFVKPQFIERCEQAIDAIAARVGVACIVGAPVGDERARGGTVQGAPQPFVRNAAVFMRDHQVVRVYAKRRIPGYGIFDEQRWFSPGDDTVVVDVECGDGSSERIGITICEDAWVAGGPIADTARSGASVIVNLSASPWRRRRAFDREAMVSARAIESGCTIALCNHVGGDDSLVFDGASVVADASGSIVARGAHCESDVVIIDTDDLTLRAGDGGPDVGDSGRSLVADTWKALSCALADYVRKNGFTKVLFGLSGGLDSAVVLALAVDALGADAVQCVTMPSTYSSTSTRDDARDMAAAWGVDCRTCPIDSVLAAYDQTLGVVAPGAITGVARENLQARIRGAMLMSISNAEGHLVLATGNKSEFSVGYATLYGDMCGGFAPLKDVPKTLVYELARWRNSRASREDGPLILPSIIDRAPSAELSENQVDADSLPDYDVLDALLEQLIDVDLSIEEVVARGFDRAMVERVHSLVLRAEYKRQQSPPGPRVTTRAFGLDRRMPITNHFDGR